jgi:hypothetical protein
MALPTDRSPSGLTAIANFSGRIWYSGAGSEVLNGDERSPNIGTFVFFTQIIDGKDKYDKCYQEADPTSEYISDLIDSDGGYVVIAGAHRVFKLVPLQNGLVVFASNGVWQIMGGENGFSATSFQVIKISDVSADSKRSIVAAENTIFFWARGGIYILSPSEISPALRPQNITEQSIQTAYTSIPSQGRKNAVGGYDPISREVRWLYNDSSSYDGTTFVWMNNKELVYNTALGAFHVNTLSQNVTATGTNESIADYYVADNAVSTDVTDDVVVSGDPVEVSAVQVVIDISSTSLRGETATKYLTLQEGTTDLEFTFAVYNDGTFKDWGRDDAKGTLITGYESFGDSQRKKRLDHLTMHCKRTETGYVLDNNSEIQYNNPSSLLVTFKWEWTETGNGTQDSDQEQAYRLPRQYIPDEVTDTFNYPYQVVSTKLRPRGSGTVMSMLLETEEEKDAHILGWGYNGSGNGRS